MSKYPTTPQEQNWIKMTKAGNGAAFSQIVTRYQQPIYNLCYHMLRDSGEAEDAAQEIFLRAYTKIDTFDQNRKFSTWLFAIASNYCIDRLKRRRVTLISWDNLAFGLADNGYQDNGYQPELSLIKDETTAEIRGLVDTLPPDYRSAVILKYWYAMPLQEIADTLNSTVSAIKSRLFRARKMMAQATTQKQSMPAPVVEESFGFAV